MITFSQIRATDVPDMDLKGGDKNVSDPYVIFTALDEAGTKLDECRTPHIENVRHARWPELTLRLFLPDDEAGAKTAPATVLITLMDKNSKKADTLIGDIKVSLAAGPGRMKVEVPSRSPSACRPHVHFRFNASAQMFFEQIEWVRLGAVEEPEADES